MEQDQQFVEYVLKAIVDNPDDVSVERSIDEMGVLISVTVNASDMGKVIGKSGQTAKAVRTLLKVVGAKNDARVNMKIIEPEGGTGPAPGSSDENPVSTDDQPTDVADEQSVPGTTDAADDVPVPEQDVAEAAADQQDTDAAVPQASENDEAVDEATGENVPEEPVSRADEEQKDNPLNEKSPLDEL